MTAVFLIFLLLRQIFFKAGIFPYRISAAFERSALLLLFQLHALILQVVF
jgi:hypothetical protein